MDREEHSKDRPSENESCRVTGLAVRRSPEWTDVGFGGDYRVTLRIIGERILHCRPTGYATIRDVEQVLAFTRRVIDEQFGPEGRYVQIEDYRGLEGSTLDARKRFIRDMEKRNRMVGLVFCSTSPLLKVSIQLAKSFTPPAYRVHIVRDYEEAAQWAVETLSRLDEEAPPPGTRDRARDAERAGPAADQDLLQFLGSIAWEAGEADARLSDAGDPSHPLKPLFEVFALIKSDLDRILEEREAAANALDIERAYLVQLFENAQLAVVRGSSGGIVQQVNPEFTRIFGYTAEEVVGRGIDDLIVPEDRREEALATTRSVEGGAKASCETVRRHKDGTRIAVELLAFPIVIDGGQVGAYSMYLDLRERVHAEAALRASEEKYRDLFENVTDLLYVHDMEGRFLQANLAFRQLGGLTGDEVTRLNARDLMPEENRDRFADYLERIRKNGTDEGFLRLVTRSGETRVVEYRNSLILGADGEPLGVRGSARDLTDRLQAEKALRESEERHRSILENMDEGYYEVDLAGNFTFVNRAMGDILGCPRDELIGMNNRRFMDEETAKTVFTAFNRVYRTGRPESGFNWETLRRDGSRGVVETSVSLKVGGGGEPAGFRGLVREVTERERDRREKRKLEAQLQHAQRMEAIGTLAGGIAHNFNNLLMGIQGNASLMALDLDAGHAHLERLKTIENLVRSGSELTRQLLGYAREGRYEVSAVDLNRLVWETAGTFGAARKEIRVHTDLHPSLHAVLADRGQVEQALMNLFVNAADAMPQGGDLFVSTRNASSDEMAERPYAPKEGSYALLVVRDTGQGMDEETRSKIFEPFFTTKGLSKGTGLGLASVYGIVKAHGGYIDVASGGGRGTTFEIRLPATTASAEQLPEKRRSIAPGSGTVLLVDDEETVLAVGAEMLDRMSYTVLEASGGKEAVRLFQERHREIDLVILDLVMPDMGGGEVFDRLRRIDPNVRVLLASGYSMEGKAADILKRGCDDFIQKPFDMTLLSQKVSGLLSRS